MTLKARGSDMKRMNSESRRNTQYDSIENGKDNQISIDNIAAPKHLSKVSYRQNLLSRQQLLDMRKTLLDKSEEIIENTYFPFTKNNLRTVKIFNDLVNFHLDN